MYRKGNFDPVSIGFGVGAKTSIIYDFVSSPNFLSPTIPDESEATRFGKFPHIFDFRQ